MTPNDEHEEGRDWDGAVGDVLDKVKKHRAAVVEVEERQKPKSQTPVLLGSLVVLLLVGVWNAWLFSRPPEGLPAEAVALDLRYDVQFVVELVEDFRLDNGRLPTVEEMSEYLDEDLLYLVNGSSFQVTVFDGDIEVTYDGTVPLDSWVAVAGGAS